MYVSSLSLNLVLLSISFVSGEQQDGVGNTCVVNPDSTYGQCDMQTSMRFIVNSCGDVYGPRTVSRALEHAGLDISSDSNATVFSDAWSYMASLNPDKLFLAGDNVYNDGIANWGDAYHPYNNNMAVILADASIDFMKYHGYLTYDGKPGPLLYSYLELLKDKVADGYSENEEFLHLRKVVNEGVHVTWDDHDYLTNDPSNPHYMNEEFRKVEIDGLNGLSGWEKKYMRFGPAHKGIERSWTERLLTLTP